MVHWLYWVKLLCHSNQMNSLACCWLMLIRHVITITPTLCTVTWVLMAPLHSTQPYIFLFIWKVKTCFLTYGQIEAIGVVFKLACMMFVKRTTNLFLLVCCNWPSLFRPKHYMRTHVAPLSSSSYGRYLKDFKIMSETNIILKTLTLSSMSLII